MPTSGGYDPWTMKNSGPIFRASGVNSSETARELASRMARNDAIEVQEMVTDVHPADAEEYLGSQITAGYKPQLPVYSFRDEYFNPFEFFWDIEAMLRHDSVTTPLTNVMAPISQMQVKVDASSTRVAKFVIDEWQKFLEMYIPTVQQNAYPYGWMGAELKYGIERGVQVVTDFKDFNPRDVVALVKKSDTVGIRVNNVPSGAKDLPGSRKGFPAKGFFYAHRPRYGNRYGRSQIEAAWKPWRRLTGRNGVEEVTDIGIYRYGTGTVVVGAPLQDTQSKNQPATTSPSGRQSALQRALEIAENLKAGSAVAKPNVYDNKGNPLWTIDFEQPRTNVPELLQAGDALRGECSKAIGFPPELIEAAETGSGFSGRIIPLQGFLMSLQPVAQGLFYAWFTQVGRPLVWWNFGPNAWVRPRVIPLLVSYRTAAMPQQPQQQGLQQPQQGGQQQAAPQQAMAQPQQQQQPDMQALMQQMAAQGGQGGQGQPGGQQPQAVSGGDPGVPAGADGRRPYQGPRGGKGYIDPQGRVHYTASLSSTAALSNSEAFLSAAGIMERILDGDDDKDLAEELVKVLPDLEPDELKAIEMAAELAGV